LAQELAIELKAHSHNVPALLGAKKVAGAPELKVAHRYPEAGAELRMLAERVHALAGRVEEPGVPVEQQVGVGLVLEAADPAPELVELRKPKAIGPVDDQRVAIVQTRTL
jgi:hypothetical protein